MKFLIEKKTKSFRTLDGYFFFAGNNFFTRVANRNDFVIDRFHFQNRLAYRVSNENFERLNKLYDKIINERKKAFYSNPYIIQALVLLKYVFIRDQRIESLKNVKSIKKANRDKKYFLKMAFKVLEKIDIKHDWLKYGYSRGIDDNWNLYIIQIGNSYLIFNINSSLLDGVPLFDGDSNPEEVDPPNKFPFKINKIKKDFLKTNVIKHPIELQEEA